MLPKAKTRSTGGLPAQTNNQPLAIVAASHVDHLTPAQLAFVVEHFAGRDAFFIESVQLPDSVEPLVCGLHGPAMGDEPIPEDEVFYATRGERKYESRMCMRGNRLTRTLTVVAGPHEGHPCVLYTAYGGPAAPREPGDPTVPADALDACDRFWREHALSAVETATSKTATVTS